MSENPVKYLKQMVIRHVKDDKLAIACLHVLNDEAFQEAPASSNSTHEHHCYPGGLPVHTAEVLDIVLGMSHIQGLDIQVLVVATIFHDYMKVRDYYRQEDGKYVKRQYAKRIHHIHGSFGEFIRLTEGVNQNLRDEIGHVILSHHGRPEWGSLIEPQSKEAIVFHMADMLSAQFGEAR